MENPFLSITSKLEELSQKIEEISIAPEIEKPIPIEEAARFLGRSMSSLYVLVSRRKIPFHKKSKRLYFFKSELAEWVKSGKSWSSKDLDHMAINHVFLAE